MAKASELAMPQRCRDHILKQFENVSDQLKHSVSKIYVMEGAYIKSLGDHAGALKAFEKALQIGYASRGGNPFEYLIDLWCVVGSLMACKDRDRAYGHLSKVSDARDFKSISPSEAQVTFKDLTLHYVMQYYGGKMSLIIVNRQ